jgi:hypothetical protein
MQNEMPKYFKRQCCSSFMYLGMSLVLRSQRRSRWQSKRQSPTTELVSRCKICCYISSRETWNGCFGVEGVDIFVLRHVKICSLRSTCTTFSRLVGFETSTAITWRLMVSGMRCHVDRYQRFGKTATSISYPEDGSRRFIQRFVTFSRLYGATSEKTEIFMFRIVRNLKINGFWYAMPCRSLPTFRENLTLTPVPMNEFFAAAKKLTM